VAAIVVLCFQLIRRHVDMSGAGRCGLALPGCTRRVRGLQERYRTQEDHMDGSFAVAFAVRVVTLLELELGPLQWPRFLKEGVVLRLCISQSISSACGLRQFQQWGQEIGPK